VFSDSEVCGNCEGADLNKAVYPVADKNRTDLWLSQTFLPLRDSWTYFTAI
jgi:hypothetical protein